MPPAVSIRELAFQEILARANVGILSGDQFTRDDLYAIRTAELVPTKSENRFYTCIDEKSGLGEEVLERVGLGDGGVLCRCAAFCAFEMTRVGDGSTPPGSAVDADLVDLERKVSGIRMKGKFHNVRKKGIAIVPAQADKPVARATLWLVVNFQHREQDPAAWE